MGSLLTVVNLAGSGILTRMLNMPAGTYAQDELLRMVVLGIALPAAYAADSAMRGHVGASAPFASIAWCCELVEELQQERLMQLKGQSLYLLQHMEKYIDRVNALEKEKLDLVESMNSLEKAQKELLLKLHRQDAIHQQISVTRRLANKLDHPTSRVTHAMSEGDEKKQAEEEEERPAEEKQHAHRPDDVKSKRLVLSDEERPEQEKELEEEAAAAADEGAVLESTGQEEGNQQEEEEDEKRSRFRVNCAMI
jgi:hypothetical protein